MIKHPKRNRKKHFSGPKKGGPQPPIIPDATYRLQFNRNFTFRDAMKLVDYFKALGISHCYASPLQKARPGSLHGYDIIDHSEINPEIGTPEDMERFGRMLRQKGMGIIMDVVPNHMCVIDPENHWWKDVLEDGRSSTYSRFFDVDWNPPKAALRDKVLLPYLGRPYGEALENQEIRVVYQASSFQVEYYSMRLPINVSTFPSILAPPLEALRRKFGNRNLRVLELRRVINDSANLPQRSEADPGILEERQRKKNLMKQQLAALMNASGDVRKAVQDSLSKLNGVTGKPKSFDRLDSLLRAQAYRLSYWRVGADEINYRRFFDINELACMRVEDLEVFTPVHELILSFMARGFVSGLRIDHIDGLWAPEKYLNDLSQAYATTLEQGGREKPPWAKPDRSHKTFASKHPFYLIVEKILGDDEELPKTWPVHGTTGYEFLNLLNGIFVDTNHEERFAELYSRFTHCHESFEDVVYGCKKQILFTSMSSDLGRLTSNLEMIAQEHRSSQDYTSRCLKAALLEVIACFPVYRAYVRDEGGSVTPEDRRFIVSAIRSAKTHNPETDAGLFDFIGSLLLQKYPKGLDKEQKAKRRDFLARFQQLTGPVMAKGFEDTALYRFYPLASLNEVGGNPARFGISVDTFHRENRKRLKAWPHGLSATSTHDTKRSEDVRTRINVLSEIPEKWDRALHQWRKTNVEAKVKIDGVEVPDGNEEYLLYQTLLGAWPLVPLGPPEPAQFIERIQGYMTKALREAKIHTSWLEPNEEYEQAVRDFVQRILQPREGNRFLSDFLNFLKPVARAGMLNSVSQTLLKIASPGTPDFYQGTELWDFSLVDPDNRRPVDFRRRKSHLTHLGKLDSSDRTSRIARLLNRPEDGRIKLYVISRALQLRKLNRELFANGEYVPLKARGPQKEHVCAFARRQGRRVIIAVAGRFFMRLGAPEFLPIGPKPWGGTDLILNTRLFGDVYRDIFTHKEIGVREERRRRFLPLPDLFSHLPVALLESET